MNYRRNDSEGEAGRLFDEMAKQFGENSVFMDVSAIEPGRDFRKAIDESVSSCSVLLAMIGQDWLNTKGAQGHRRLEDANDFVRIELASALRRDIPVVPVLVRGAKMPTAEELPDDLKELAFRNAVELTHARWKSDVEVLIRALRPYMDEPGGDRQAQETREPGREAIAKPAPKNASAPAAVAAIDAPTLERVTRALAVHIGPIAEVVVRRAAKRCSSVEDFYERVANEIENEADRARFLKSSRS
ncbi:MAG: TIR domain-containing protein [Acidobacteriaceae bacterium]